MHQPFRKASVYIGLMLILEVLTGLGIIIVTAVYQFFLSSYLDDIECRLVMSYFVNVYIFGVQLIVTFICSISLWNRLWKRRCTPNIRLMIALWLFYSCIIIASGFGATWNIYYSMDVLENAAETSLLRGIDDYYSSPDWKLLWDGLQIRKQCCGVNSYRDWMEAEWMPRQTRAGQKCGKSVLAPIACTKRGAEPDIPNYMLMGEDFSQKNAKRPMFPKLTIDMINTSGCLPIFMKDLWRYFYILLFLVLLALKFLVSSDFIRIAVCITFTYSLNLPRFAYAVLPSTYFNARIRAKSAKMLDSLTTRDVHWSW